MSIKMEGLWRIYIEFLLGKFVLQQIVFFLHCMVFQQGEFLKKNQFYDCLF